MSPRESIPAVPHVAIIPDGNGRWARQRGLPRNLGHRRGCEVVRKIVRAARSLGVRQLTLYAFSMENWARPREEVDAIMSLLDSYLKRETDELVERGVRVSAIGRLHLLERDVQDALRELERRTEANAEMRLTFALSYGGRSEITDAVRKLAREVEAGRVDPDAIDEKRVRAALYDPELPDPDLLIRTGGEHRISNFLLWQMAYTELWTTDTLWPDFSETDLRRAFEFYGSRERRFGRTGDQAPRRGEA
ncbi:MAG: di-trans,poly-cis-decaprenylcistransferase [Proteobacteria bacterium]|nr:di-trans,poly-cis-decaprenylcistransferase [Pseudomonadota bacterium]